MIDSVAAWAAGFTAGAGIGFFYGNRMPRDRDPNWRRSFNHENTNRPSGPPPLKLLRGPRRVCHSNPATIAECGGPCEEGGLAACDCGAVTWTNQPVKHKFPLPRKIKEDWQ